MEKYKYKGKNEQELIETACDELEVKEDEILTKTYEESAGILKGKRYVVEVIKLQDAAELGKSLLQKVLNGLSIEGKIETKIREKQISYEIFSNNNSILIGKRGHILESIQNFIRQALYNKLELYINIVVDVENYKQKQIMHLERKVKNIAREVKFTKIDVKLDPMNSYERRIVHNVLSKFETIETESIGEEPNRYIVIKYKKRD